MENREIEEVVEATKPYFGFLDENIRQKEGYDLNIIDLHIEHGKELLKDQWEQIKDLESKRLHVSLIILALVPYYFLNISLHLDHKVPLAYWAGSMGHLTLFASIWYSFKHYGGLLGVGHGSLPSTILTWMTVDHNLKEQKLTQLGNIEVRARINKIYMIRSNIQLIRQMQSLMLTAICLMIFMSVKAVL